ncbi:MAG: hypothetical protein GYA50_09460 [Eubacteriaceae bacterium]|nr:hypothetical protein [Eubacteriaceae bacterium]
MNNLESIINICKSYINGVFDVEEFQHQLEQVILPDNFKYTLEKEQHNAVNRLEEIRFSYLPENQNKYAIEVAEELIHLTRNYINKK